jgi:hypothetical protein
MLHHIIIDFPGSQDGRITESFYAGTTVELSDYLAAIVVPAGWARPVSATIDVESKPMAEQPAVTTMKRGKAK